MSLAPGKRLGAYEILSPLGAGGMGEVYRARDTRLLREVAVKVLPEEFFEGQERRQRFEREARLLAALNHPGIASIYSFEEIPGAPGVPARHVLVMELIEGDSLDTLIPPGGLPLSQFLDISVPLADAISAAHERGIVHRDLKPGNVMVTREGRVKVLDFGLAKLESPGPSADLTSTPTESRANLTSEGQVYGTVAYMSPEQARGIAVDARSDVFSFGVVGHGSSPLCAKRRRRLASCGARPTRTFCSSRSPGCIATTRCAPTRASRRSSGSWDCRQLAEPQARSKNHRRSGTGLQLLAFRGLATQQERLREPALAADLERAEVLDPWAVRGIRLRLPPEFQLVEVLDGDLPIAQAVEQMVA